MERQIEDLLKQMTLEEKVGMIHGAGLFRTEGVERLGIPPLKMSDGPMGVRAEFKNAEWVNQGTTEDLVTYLPSNSALASTWNPGLAKKAGQVLGEEARGRGKDVILAPGINIKRSPLCGRNFEYMSEDPRLVEKMCVPLIQGIQEFDVAACVKHFAANSQETERLFVDTILDRQTMEEIYFPGFYAAVKEAKTYSLMGAYNLLNGEHCSTSKKLLNDILRKEWGYDGTVISDWGAVHDTELAAGSGLDVEMDVKYDFEKQYMADALLEKVRAGEIEESCIDEKVCNILRMMLRLKMIGEEREERKAGTYNTREHQQAVLEVAEESMILLKNEKKVLPLQRRKIRKLAVIGKNAEKIHSNGGGSAEIKALYEISPLMGICKYLGGNTQVVYAKGYEDDEEKTTEGETNWQALSTDGKQETKEKKYKETPQQQADRLLQEALEAAKDADAVIFVGGLNHKQDVEGLDRSDLSLPYGQDRVIEALLKVRPDTIITLVAGSVVAMPWKEQADTILFSYYAGMETGTAMAEVLFGEKDPSGRLPETMIDSIAQCPAHTVGTFGDTKQVEYKEGIMVGYRYYDTKKTEVAFAFGHGLSYTTFDYQDLALKQSEDGVQVSVEVENTGDRTGSEVVQVYIGYRGGEKERPVHELKGFKKIELAPQKKERVEIFLPKKDFEIYDMGHMCRELLAGEYEIQVGSSSRNIRLADSVKIM